MKSKAVFGILPTQAEAEALITDLEAAGFVVSDISLLFPNKGQSRDFVHTRGTKAPEGAIVGGGTGGLAGGVFGLLAGIGAIAIPGLGAFIAAGPILAVLSGAAVGAAVGSITGGLMGLGIPELQAKAYEGKIQGGNILVAVHAEDASRVDAAKRVLKARGADDIAVTNEARVPAKKSETHPRIMRKPWRANASER